MALEVEIYARNMEVTDRIQEYATKKVSESWIDISPVSMRFAWIWRM